MGDLKWVFDSMPQAHRALLPGQKVLATGDVLAHLRRNALQSSRLEVLECVVMSGSALDKELNTPHEDDAWAHLTRRRSGC